MTEEKETIPSLEPKSIKLISREEIVGLVNIDEENGYINIFNPLQIIPSFSDGIMILQFMPFIISTNDDLISIPLDFVITITSVAGEVMSNYEAYFNEDNKIQSVLN